MKFKIFVGIFFARLLVTVSCSRWHRQLFGRRVVVVLLYKSVMIRPINREFFETLKEMLLQMKENNKNNTTKFFWKKNTKTGFFSHFSLFYLLSTARETFLVVVFIYVIWLTNYVCGALSRYQAHGAFQIEKFFLCYFLWESYRKLESLPVYAAGWLEVVAP